MEIEVSKHTVDKVIEAFRKNKLVTKKDIPDLDCPYVGNHLENQMQKIHNDIEYKGIYTNKKPNCIGVLYSTNEYTEQTLIHRLKKFKF